MADTKIQPQIVFFDSGPKPKDLLPANDRLYRSILVPVQTKGAELPAWLYVVGDRWTGSYQELTDGIWH